MNNQLVRPLALLLTLSLGLGLAGCGESSFDIYMRGLKQSNEANKVHCQMLWDQASSAMIINSEKIITCKQANEDALETIRQAQAAGFANHEQYQQAAHRMTQGDQLMSRKVEQQANRR